MDKSLCFNVKNQIESLNIGGMIVNATDDLDVEILRDGFILSQLKQIIVIVESNNLKLQVSTYNKEHKSSILIY